SRRSQVDQSRLPFLRQPPNPHQPGSSISRHAERVSPGKAVSATGGPRATAHRRSAGGSSERTTQMAISASFNPIDALLTVLGDDADNTVTVSRDAAGDILVNGGAVPVARGPPNVANTATLDVSGKAGNDTITLDESNGALPAAEISGGAGNDVLTGGSGNDRIFGGAGNDTINGGGGGGAHYARGGENVGIWGGGGETGPAPGGEAHPHPRHTRRGAT